MSTITLSFDNGPDPIITPKVLSILKKYHIKTSFFMVGTSIEALQDEHLLNNIYDQGHWICNHTYTHTVQLGETKSAKQAIDEIEKCQRLISSFSHPCKYFRPYGAGGILSPALFNEASIEYLAANQYSCVLWNCIAYDWEDQNWIEGTLQQVANLEHALIVLHDFLAYMPETLDHFIQKALEQGHQFTQFFPESSVVMCSGEVSNALLVLSQKNQF
ncbi:polysaccharide deacetylase family protein [Fangia hongkongensis]|uniref:polysaccharide deacetylase family protein n=1 Tax=Fangia hongkongensis TaxID=270495 RepID=UPI00037FAB79|nr:polysaccharide deacetylase family protein [Fangia hongkongensis]MBK2125433.1 polysaccharide deacetylase family protein [Fangia hongkongensis]